MLRYITGRWMGQACHARRPQDGSCSPADKRHPSARSPCAVDGDPGRPSHRYREVPRRLGGASRLYLSHHGTQVVQDSGTDWDLEVLQSVLPYRHEHYRKARLVPYAHMPALSFRHLSGALPYHPLDVQHSGQPFLIPKHIRKSSFLAIEPSRFVVLLCTNAASVH